MLNRLRFAACGASCILLVMLGSPKSLAAAASFKTHRLLLQVDTGDAETMNLALNNAINAKKYYDDKREKLSVEIVAYGPGITMLRADTSPVKDHLNEAKASIPDIVLSMCGKAKAGAEKREGHEIPVIPGVKVVTAGIVRVMELEEEGWTYVRP